MDELSFDITKLNEVCDLVNTYYNEYKESVTLLEQEIKKLETTWGSKDQSAYTAFKEKYEEKKPKLAESEAMMRELFETLEAKRVRKILSKFKRINRKNRS